LESQVAQCKIRIKSQQAAALHRRRDSSQENIQDYIYKASRI